MNISAKTAKSSAQQGPFFSQGNYPAVQARWYLDDIGLNRNALNNAWGQAVVRSMAGQKATTIAVIDTPVASDHPNLQDGAIDLVHKVDLVTEHDADIQTRINAGSAAAPSPDEGLRARASHGTAVAGLMVGRPTAAGLFSSDIVTKRTANKDGAEDPTEFAGKVTRLPLAFTGIDPTATVVPIAISAEPSLNQMNRALDHVERIPDVSLIVFAADLSLPGLRDFAADDFRKPGDKEVIKLCNRLMVLSLSIPIVCAAGNEPIEAEDDEVGPEVIAKYLNGVSTSLADVEVSQLATSTGKKEKLKVKKLEVSTSTTRASDDTKELPRKTLAFPAILADDTNGIISVTAHNAAGQRASYAPAARNITFSAPSSDGERLDRDLARLDRFRVDFGEDDEEVYLPDGASAKGTEYMPPHAIITTDVPGRYGQNGSNFDDPVFLEDLGATELAPFLSETDPAAFLPELALKLILEGRSDVKAYSDFGSNYCFFGGTSAACAIVGGVLSLAISAGHFQAGNVLELKKALSSGAMQPIDWSNINQGASEAKFSDWQGDIQ